MPETIQIVNVAYIHGIHFFKPTSYLRKATKPWHIRTPSCIGNIAPKRKRGPTNANSLPAKVTAQKYAEITHWNPFVRVSSNKLRTATLISSVLKDSQDPFGSGGKLHQNLGKNLCAKLRTHPIRSKNHWKEIDSKNPRHCNFSHTIVYPWPVWIFKEIYLKHTSFNSLQFLEGTIFLDAPGS